MEKRELKKEIGFFAALTVVIGTVIGSGIFFKPQAVFSATGTAGLGLLVWFLGGLISLCGGLTAAELSAAIPETGGMVTWMKKIFGDLTSYLLGWVMSVVYVPGSIAALAIIFGTQAVTLLGIGDGFIIPIAIIATVLIMGLNLLGAKAGGRVQSISTVAKLIPIALIIVFGLFHDGDVTVRLFPMSTAEHPFFAGLGAGLLATLFAYDGWIHVGNIAGEMKNPKRDLPKAIIIGLVGVTAIYMIINVAYLMAMDPSALAATDTPAADAAMKIFGSAGGRIITIGILVSVFGTINGYTMTGMRIPYVMAKENKLPFSNWIGKLSKTGVPYNAGILITCIAILMIFSGQFNQLTDMVVFVIWIFYFLTFIGVFKLRMKEPNLTRPYKVPLYPVIPIVAILGGAFISINTIITQPMNASVGLLLTAIGLPIYFLRKDKHIYTNKKQEG